MLDEGAFINGVINSLIIYGVALTLKHIEIADSIRQMLQGLAYLLAY